MKLDIRIIDLPDRERLIARAARRLDFALGRFASRIDRVRLSLADENGGRGGIDKVCRIAVVLRTGVPSVFVQVRAEDAEAAVDMAANRAGRNLAQTLDRMRRRVRVTPPAALMEQEHER